LPAEIVFAAPNWPRMTKKDLEHMPVSGHLESSASTFRMLSNLWIIYTELGQRSQILIL